MPKPIVPNLEELSAQQLQELDAELVQMFNASRAEELTVERVVEVSELASAIEEVRSESGRRAELAAGARAEAAAKVEALAARIAGNVELKGNDALNKDPLEAVRSGVPHPQSDGDDKAASDDQDGGKVKDADFAGISSPAVTDTGGAGKEDDEVPAKETMEDLAAEVEKFSRKAEKLAAKVAGHTELAAKVEALSVKLSPSLVSGASAPIARVPATTWTGTPAIVASADVPGYTAGGNVDGMIDVAKMMMARKEGIRGTSAAGDGEQVLVASIKGSFPDERKLSNVDVFGNQAKIDAITSPSAITAAGGVCAPAEPYYGLLNISSVDRPVKAALPTFMADRGSIRFIPPPILGQLTGAISITTEQQDASGYPPTATKNVLHVTCATEQQVYVTAISRILEFGNFGARTFPEQVEIWTNLSIAQAARQADGYLLTQISNASTQITAAKTFGASRELLTQVDRAAASMRSRNRTDPNLVLRFMAPYWIKNLFRADLANTHFYGPQEQFNITDAMIDQWFAVRNIAPTYYLDQATGAGQVFGTQSAGALLTFPSTVNWFLFAEGSFLHLDAGVLDLGLVRDSTLNSTNDYEIFAEMFENVAFVGVESYSVTSTVCADGTYAPAGSTLSCPQ